MIQRPDWFSKILSLLTAAVMLFMVLPSGAAAADFTLRWDPNPEADLAGYKVHYKEKSHGEPYDGQGADQGNSPIIVRLALLEDTDNPQYQITGLQDNKIYFFVLTAYDQGDPPHESDYSNIASKLRITHPEDNFILNQYSDYSSYTVSGHGLTEASIQILANGVLLGVADTDPNGYFAINVDFSVLNEGVVELTAKQKESTTYPVTGIFDIKNPSVSSWDLGADDLTLTFDERYMQNVDVESSYRFSPSMSFRSSGGIVKVNAFAYRLSLKTIPAYEIISLEMTGITDGVGNRLVPASITINDRDEDQMADDWEVASGLDPTTPNSGADIDGDGFSNLSEYQARTDPNNAASSPIAVVDSIPQPNAGILNSAWVPDDTSFAVFIASVHGIDVDDSESIRITVDDEELDPYSRNLNSETVRVVEVETNNDVVLLWVVYDRSLETVLPMAYAHDANIHITVEVEDIAGNALPPAHFDFNIESVEEQERAWNNLPDFVFLEPLNAGSGNDAGVEIVSGELAGARIEYDDNEPLTPMFGPMNEIGGVAAAALGMEGAGLPLNLLPHTVFNTPVKVFIPVPDGSDLTEVGIYFYNGVEWLPACDENGNILPGGEGWMVAGSRVNHMESSPPLVEVQVYHFSAAQAVNSAFTSGSTGIVAGSSSGGGGSCFISSAGEESWGSLLGWVSSLSLLGLWSLLGLLSLLARFNPQITQITPMK
jgi:hypothetical protein